MFVREPIVLSCSMLSGFSDMLIFIFLDSFTPGMCTTLKIALFTSTVFSQWGFTPWQTGLCFLSILVSYFIAWASFLPFFRSAEKRRKRGLYVSPEDRLYWLLYLAPLEAIGLFGFAWTSMGPEHNHWFGPIFFAALIGIANYAIYMATIDYMVAAYGWLDLLTLLSTTDINLRPIFSICYRWKCSRERFLVWCRSDVFKSFLRTFPKVYLRIPNNYTGMYSYSTNCSNSPPLFLWTGSKKEEQVRSITSW